MNRPRKLDALFPAERSPGPLDRLRALRQVVRRDLVYGYLLYPYGRRKQKALVGTADFSQNHLYTACLRLPAQYDVLLGPVLDHVGVDPDGRRDTPLKITVLAGSIGAEAYTLSAVLGAAVPDLDFEIECSDLHEETVARSRKGLYDESEVLRHQPPASLIGAMFDVGPDGYEVKDAVRSRVSFVQADIVNDDLTHVHAPSDIVFVQNVFCHFDDETTAKALDNVLRIAKPTAAVFMDGMSLDVRVRLTQQHDLEPIDLEIHRVHRQARRHVPAAWWTKYYGFEPYLPFRAGRRRRYATVFKR